MTDEPMDDSPVEQMIKITRFTDLYSDILLEIFSYLTLNDIVDAFEEILPSLWSLIDEGHVKLFVNQSIHSPTIWKKISTEQIFTLTMSYDDIDRFIWSTFVSLCSITLENFVSDQENSLIKSLEKIPSLKRIRLKLSEKMFHEKIFFEQCVRLPMLKHLRIDLMKRQSSFFPQINWKLLPFNVPSVNITVLEIHLPLSWRTLINFLQYFLCLKILRAHLYPMENTNDDIFSRSTKLPLFRTLQTLDLVGFFHQMTLIIDRFCLPMKNLRSCRLLANNVVTDDLNNIIRFDDQFFGRRFIQRCSRLKSLKIHMLLPIDSSIDHERDKCKERYRAFNHEPFCQRYHFNIDHRSMLNGYVTFSCDYHSTD